MKLPPATRPWPWNVYQTIDSLGADERLASQHRLDEHIQHLLSPLRSRLVGLVAVAKECRMEIFAGVFADDVQACETGPWQTLRTLGDCHVDLDLDVYPAEGA